jgi:beta-glucosidase
VNLEQLARFAKVNLNPRDRERVTVTLDPHALSYWDEATDRWVTPRGTLPVYVGSSVQDIRLTGSVRIPGLAVDRVVHARSPVRRRAALPTCAHANRPRR